MMEIFFLLVLPKSSVIWILNFKKWIVFCDICKFGITASWAVRIWQHEKGHSIGRRLKPGDKPASVVKGNGRW